MRTRSSGFTLVEILVVVVIVGIMLTFATLAIDSAGDRAVEDKLVTEAERIEQLFKLAQEEAELKGVEIGFLHTERGYAFVISPEGRWVAINDGPLRPRAIPEPLQFALRVEDRPVPPAAELPEATNDADDDDGKDKKQNDEAPKFEPQLLILSSGEITPFSLDISTPVLPVRYRIGGTLFGALSRERFDKDTLR